MIKSSSLDEVWDVCMPRRLFSVKRRINHCLHVLIDTYLSIYLDPMLVFSKPFMLN